MVISHKHRYLFIEIPLTASWAIRHELCSYHDGEPILHKHATFAEFCRLPAVNDSDYFVFAAVRNPLDAVVSQYLKLKTDHKGTFSDPASTETMKADFSDIKKYRFIRENDASFADFFRHYYRRPYSDLIDYSANRLDFVIRFEQLQEGFTEALRRLGLEQVRPIPPSNKTGGKKGHWQDHYTPEIIPQARQIFGPFMERWGYEFPAEWGTNRVSRWDRFKYRSFNAVRALYVNHFKYSSGAPARLARSLRATFK